MKKLISVAQIFNLSVSPEIVARCRDVRVGRDSWRAANAARECSLTPVSARACAAEAASSPRRREDARPTFWLRLRRAAPYRRFVIGTAWTTLKVLDFVDTPQQTQTLNTHRLMKIKMSIRHWLRALATAACLVSVTSVSAQPADGPGGPGGPGGRRGGRGFGPQLPPEQMAAVNSITTNLTAEALAVTVASSNLVAATFATPKDEAKIVAANNALTKAREAWAMKASALFAKVQTSTNKLSEAAIAQLIASAPGGGGRGRGGFGGGFPGGPGGPGAGGRRGQ